MRDVGEDILELVMIPSVTGDEGALADHLTARLARGRFASAYQTVRLGDSIVVRPSSTAGSRRRRPVIVFAGHTDTVPLAECGPPRRADGEIQGRGAADMKAGLAVMLRLMEEIEPSRAFADLAFVFYTGEEGPSDQNALGPILESQPWLTDAALAILCEPTSGALELGCQGSLHLEVELRGVACHSARPWLGRHAMKDALPWLSELFDRPTRDVELAGVRFREVVSVTNVRAGDARNVIPGTASVNVNLRYPPDRTFAEAEQFALSLAPDRSLGVAKIVDHAPAGSIPSHDPYYAHLLSTTGLPRRAKQAWTDVARFSSVGTPALNWGPGDPGVAHTRDERVAIDEAQRCLDAMTLYLTGPGPEAPPEPARERSR